MKLTRIITVVCLAALLSGCSGGSVYSNYREIEQLMVIQTMGFDYAKSGVRLSASSGSDSAGGGGGGNAKGGEQGGSAQVARLSAEAESFSLAKERMQDYSAREDLYFAHTSYIAVGGESAKKSVMPFFDYIERSPELRLDIPLFVVTNGAASELVLGAGGESYDATSVLRSLERNLTLRGDGVIYNAAQIVTALDTNGCALISAVKAVKADESVKEAKQSELTAIPDGYTVIKNGKAVGSIPIEYARGVNILQNKVGPSSVELDTDGTRATVQLDKCSCDINPVFDGEHLAGLDIQITLTAALSETADSIETQKLSRALANTAKLWVTKVLGISQSLECDFLQLGSVLERKEPKRLAGMSSDLSESLPSIYYNVGVEAEVNRSFDVGLGSSK